MLYDLLLKLLFVKGAFSSCGAVCIGALRILLGSSLFAADVCSEMIALRFHQVFAVCNDQLIIFGWLQSQDCVHFNVNFEFLIWRRADRRIMFLLLLCYLLTIEDCCFDTYIYDIVPSVLRATSLAR